MLNALVADRVCVRALSFVCAQRKGDGHAAHTREACFESPSLCVLSPQERQDATMNELDHASGEHFMAIERLSRFQFVRPKRGVFCHNAKPRAPGSPSSLCLARHSKRPLRFPVASTATHPQSTSLHEKRARSR